MAGFDDDAFSLSGLRQEGHEVDVTVISDSDDNYEGLLECAKALQTDNISHKTSKSDDSVVWNKSAKEPGAEVRAKGVLLELPSSGLNVSNNMASSVSDEEKSIGVSFIEIYPVEVSQICVQRSVILSHLGPRPSSSF